MLVTNQILLSVIAMHTKMYHQPQVPQPFGFNSHVHQNIPVTAITEYVRDPQFCREEWDQVWWYAVRVRCHGKELVIAVIVVHAWVKLFIPSRN